MNYEELKIKNHQLFENRKSADGGQFFWGSREEQDKRFSELMKLGDFTNKSVLDVGCGYGDFLDYLINHNQKPSFYYGTDIEEEAIAKAKALHPSATWEVSDLSNSRPRMRFDYVIASGLFCIASFRWAEFVKDYLAIFLSLSKKGVAVNFTIGTISSIDNSLYVTTEQEVRDVIEQLKNSYRTAEFNVSADNLTVLLYKEI